MNIILDNIVFNLQKAGGISVYWFELTKRFASSGENISFIEHNGNSNNIFRQQININNSIILKKDTIPVKLSRYMPVKLKLHSNAIFHSSYFRICTNKNVVNIITVYDFIYELFESGIRNKIHLTQKKYALNNADAIICISESTRKDLLRLYPNISSDKVRVIHIAAGDFFVMPDKKQQNLRNYEFIFNRKYVLYVGNRGGHKNFNIVIDVMKQLDGFSLVAVGGGDLNDEEKRKLSQLSGRFSHIKSPDSNDLNILYNYAFCLIYPSSYEGFGIPIAEAMKAGCPVIASSVSSIPEVAGNAGLMINTICVDEIISKINMLNDEAYRNKVIELGLVQGNSFSWDRCYKETIECYTQAYNNKFNKNL